MAAVLLGHMLLKEGIKGIEVFSRGTNAWPGQPLTEGARQALQAVGVETGTHYSQSLARKDVEQADRIYVMTERHRQTVTADYPRAKDKTRLLAAADIADPVGSSPRDYEKCRIDIQNALVDLISSLKSEGSSKS